MNDNFSARQEVKENCVVCSLTFLQLYILMLFTSVEDKNECGIYEKNLKNLKSSSDILTLYW